MVARINTNNGDASDMEVSGETFGGITTNLAPFEMLSLVGTDPYYRCSDAETRICLEGLEG